MNILHEFLFLGFRRERSLGSLSASFIILTSAALLAPLVTRAAEINASAIQLYQSETNDASRLGNFYDGPFVVGSYSKNYAMVSVVYFDLSGFDQTTLHEADFILSIKLTSVISTPNNLNIDYLGTFADLSHGIARYSATSLDTFQNVLTYCAVSGTYDFNVSPISDDGFLQRYAAFRFYQTGYVLGDGITKEYLFSSDLLNINLSITPVPEVASSGLIAGMAAILVALILLKLRRRNVLL